MRIITRGVDDYVILGDRSFSVLHELFYKDRLIIPARDNEKMIGLKLFGVGKGSLLEQLGLKNGDVIRRINNVGLDSPDNAVALEQAFKRTSRVTLDLVRGGAERTLSYEVR